LSNEQAFITLADGTLIDARSGKRAVATEINKAFSDRPETSSLRRTQPEFENATRRYLDDLPTEPSQSRAVAVIAGYTLFGLSPADIAEILKIEMDIVVGIIESDAYNLFLEAILQNVREHDRNKLRKILNDKATKAVTKITDLVSSADEKVALKAAQDVLNRVAGDGLSDSTKTNSNNGGGLTIRIIDERDNPLDKVKVEIDA